MHATGTFDITTKHQAADNPDAKAAGLTRLALDKRYLGGLQAEGHGEMLATGDGRGAGAYVAIEKLSGALQGREGSFALVHRALMRGGNSEGWTVVIVPGSGTGGLAGIDGGMSITIVDGVHHYALDYSLPE